MPGPGSYFDPAMLTQLMQQLYFPQQEGSEQPQQAAMRGGPSGVPGASLDSLVTEYAGGSGNRSYQSVPDTLMGFRRYGPNKGFDESKYPFTQHVEITLPSGEKFNDAIKGLNASHALERAFRNWEGSLIRPLPAPK